MFDIDLHLLFAFVAGLVAGGINSVAGGGSMVSFPILIAMGVPPLLANATNTVGIWPGAIGSVWGFRKEFARVPKVYHWLLLPALLGSIGGAILLRYTSQELFNRLVPGLIFFATIMFVVSPAVRERLKRHTGSGGSNILQVVLAVVLQLGVAVYGGYFGAGMSILMLSILSLIGLTDLLEMSAMTSYLSLAINGIAGLIFAYSGLIEWAYAGAMAVGAVLGGYFAAGLARKVGALWIRRLVIAVGLTLAVVMLVRVIS